jgi:hypothetical protein
MFQFLAVLELPFQIRCYIYNKKEKERRLLFGKKYTNTQISLSFSLTDTYIYAKHIM